jgi:putative ABC transport system substrate-binding protein
MTTRREFITLIGGAVGAAWPVVARAQQATGPTIGFLSSTALEPVAHLMPAFHQGLGDTGFVEGRNLAIEYRWAEGKFDRLSELARDLVRRQMSLIVTIGGEPAALAAKAATSTIPIVFGIGGDPVKINLVASLNRPGGNATGISLLTPGMGQKQIEMLVELVPKMSLMALLVNPTNPLAEVQKKEMQEATQVVAKRVLVLNATSEKELDDAFVTLAQAKAEGLVIVADPFFISRRDQLVALAARYAVPTVYGFREFATAGGLMSYGSSPSYAMKTIGNYAGQILLGKKPSELPIWQAVKVELILNLKTAKALGLAIPVTILGRADEVIE